ncbi:MAG: TrmH family RNA methyltransferase [Planctomycetota bacterium]|jgi:tRNA G18 (ribose-2'-O)-methylase SpoU
MPIEHITDTDDPRLDPYRSVRDADLRGARRLFLCEGRLVVETLLGIARFETHSVLVSQRQLDSMRATLESHREVTALVVDQEFMNTIVGFDIHRGVLAAGVRPAPCHLDGLLRTGSSGPARSRVFVLEELANHDNVGGIFRNAMAFGIDCVSLDPKCCDPLYRKSIRVSMGSVLSVAFTHSHSCAESIDILREQGYHVAALTPRRDALGLDGFAQRAAHIPKLALCLGAEGPGLSGASLDKADSLVRIEMADGIDSLNVMVSSAIAAHACRYRL